MKRCGAGLMLGCQLMLSGCASVPPSPAVTLTVNGCPRLTPCRFPAANPLTNGDLNNQLDATEAALAMCADQVDMTMACQESFDAKTAIPAPRAD
ncbi:Rz1-like lysis system protein LysC [Lonsdalea quercina]